MKALFKRHDAFLSARPVRAATQTVRSLWAATAVFLSARPVRAATLIVLTLSASFPGFYPRDPCGPRQAYTESWRADICFYPRDPCGPRLLVYNSLNDKTKSLYISEPLLDMQPMERR